MEFPLTVVHCFRSPVGGLFRHVCDLVRRQAKLGLRIGIVCDSLTGGEHAKDTMERLVADFGITVHRIPMCRTLGWLDRSAFNKTREICRALTPAIVHGHGAKGGAYARLIAKGVGAKSVYTPHGGSLHYSFNFPGGFFYLGFERLLTLATDGIIFESNFTREAYVNKVGKIKGLNNVIYNGVHDSEFVSVTPEDNRRDFLFVGELRRLKGVEVLLEALSILQKERRITALLVGDGPDSDVIRSRIRDLDLEGAITIEPSMYPASGAFSSARFIVIPSLKESLPYVVLEAAAANMPQITSSVGGIPEIFGPHADRLIPPNDPDCLAGAMLDAIDNPDTARRVATDLQGRVKRLFRAESMVKSTIDFYGKVLGIANLWEVA